MAWILRDRIATWDTGEWTVSVDLNTNPRLAVRRSGLDRFLTVVQPQDGDEILSDSTLLAADAYIRDNDLVVAYPEQAPLRFGYQTYFSMVDAPAGIVAIESWLSVQTSTLEAYPQLRLGLGANGVSFEANTTAGVFLSADRKIALLVHSLDADDACLATEGINTPALQVFGRFMEKGVIRRLRVRILVAEWAIEDSQWQKCRSDFEASPLPLTV